MPYIDQVIRKHMKTSQLHVMIPGDLNYAITSLVNDYLGDHGVSYHTLNECIGVLECAKLELYRRIVAPYEDKKMKENGDVYNV